MSAVFKRAYDRFTKQSYVNEGVDSTLVLQGYEAIQVVYGGATEE